MTIAQQERYEGFFILDPDLSEEAVSKVQAQVADQIVKLGGTVERQQPWGKRRLAYRVRRRRDGFYVLILFAAGPAAIAALDQWCALHESILRRLIVRAISSPPQPVEAATSHGEPQ